VVVFATGRRNAASGGAAPVSRRLILLAATVLALMWQGFATGTHVHFPSARTISTQDAAFGASARTSSHRHSSADCPLCRAIAQAGHYVTPEHGRSSEPGPVASPQPRAAYDAGPHGRTWSLARPIRGPPHAFQA
jgi:hypothetical protein